MVDALASVEKVVVPDNMTLREIGTRVVRSDCPEEKARWTCAAHQVFCVERRRLLLGNCINIGPGERPTVAGLQVVAAGKMPSIGKGGSARSRSMMLHALVHVELAAVDLSWDILLRDWGLGRDLGEGFYLDWLEVAYEECKHYLILRARLQELGEDYGSYPVHDSIWEDALKTKDSLVERLVLEHCTHEARGVDTCALSTIPRLRKGGDDASADLLEFVVLPDEVSHIRKGLAYFKLIAGRPGEVEEEEHIAAFREVQRRVFAGAASRGPFAVDLRAAAGFTPAWYEAPPLVVDVALVES